MKKLFATITSLLILLVSVFSLSACKSESGDVSIKYYADGAKIVQAMLGGEEEIGLVPEPAATNLIKRANALGKTLYRLDLQELYDKDAKSYPQAVLMVKESVLNTYPNIVSALQTAITDSVSFAKTNTESAVNAIKSKLDATSLNASALSESAIDGCKIYFESASSAKTAVKTYVNELIELSESSAKAITDDFFYDGTASGDNQKSTLSVYAPDGAPALAISKLINDNSDLGTGKTLEYNIVATTLVPAQLLPAYRGGNADIIILPINLASKFYNAIDNANDPYKMVSVVTHGNFYIVSTEEITISDLKDKRVAVPQQNAVPDWTFRTVLKKHNLNGKNIEE